MDIKNPEYILEIARQQSVTHAAEKLFVTQSTLSQYLLKLENELGTPLFSREKSGLVPTEAGHVYLHAARAVVQIQNAAEASIAALKKEGFLCVGVSFWGLTLLTGLLPAFKSRFPDITLRIFVDDYAHLKVMMQAGRIDLAVISITEEDDRPAQGAVNLRREELVVALPREAAYCLEHPDAEFISEKQLPQALDTLDFIALDEGASIRRRRECLSCHKRFTTYEMMESLPLVVVKKDGSRQSFDRNKVMSGLIRACEKRPVSVNTLEELVTEIEQVLQNEMEREVSSAMIGELVMERLKKVDEVAYVRFASVYRQFKDINTFMQELNKLLEDRR